MENSTVVFLIALIMAVATLTPYTINEISFNQNCGGHLKLASNANTIEMAEEQLDIAIAYAEANGLTNGFTSVYFKTPADDIGFWYKNLKATRAQLADVKESSSELEKSNVLLKLRETLLDHTEKGGEELAIPNGLARTPHNFWWGTCLVIGILSSITALFAAYIRLSHR